MNLQNSTMFYYNISIAIMAALLNDKRDDYKPVISCGCDMFAMPLNSLIKFQKLWKQCNIVLRDFHFIINLFSFAYYVQNVGIMFWMLTSPAFNSSLKSIIL